MPPRPHVFCLGAVEMHRRIGSGGMGEVWRGRVPGQPRPVAVKLLRPTAAISMATATQAIQNEQTAAARLQHPHIIRLLGHGRVTPEEAQRAKGQVDAERPYLILEFASGGPLKFSAPPPRWTEVRALTAALLDALAHAHARGVLHLDLKRQNLLWATPDDGMAGIKIADFGLAHFAGQGGDPRPPPRLGSARTMAPELWVRPPDAPPEAVGPIGPSTDLYALGCILYHELTGCPAWPQSTHREALLARIAGPPPERPARCPVPEGWWPFLLGLLAPNPRARFLSAAEARTALDRLEDPVSTRPFADEKTPSGIDLRPTADALADAAPVSTETDSPEDIATWHDAPAGLAPEAAADSEAPATDAVTQWDAEAPAADEDWTAELTVEQADAQANATGLPPIDLFRAADAPERSAPRPLPEAPIESAPAPDPLPAIGRFRLATEGPVLGQAHIQSALWAALRDRPEAPLGGLQVIGLRGPCGRGAPRLARWLLESAEALDQATTLSIRPALAGGADVAGSRGLGAGFARALGINLGAPERQLLGHLPWQPHEDAAAIQTLAARTRRALTEGQLDIAALLAWCRRWGAHRPLLIHVEEAHALDRDTRAFIDGLKDANLPALLVLSALADAPGIDRAPESLADRPIAWLDVPPLSPADLRRLVQTWAPLDEALANQIVRRSDGNPGFAQALLLEWHHAGALAEGPFGWRCQDESPPAPRPALLAPWADGLAAALDAWEGSAAEKLERLAVHLDAFARAGETEGAPEPVWAALSAEAGGPPASETPDGQRLLEPGPDGWRFIHPGLRFGLIARADAAGRLRAHHQGAMHTLEAYLQTNPGAEVRAQLLRPLAFHAQGAGDLDTGAQSFLDAAELDLRREHYAAAGATLDERDAWLWREQVPEDHPAFLAAQRCRAELMLRQGNPKEADRLAATAVGDPADTPGPGVRARCAAVRAAAAWRGGELEAARTWWQAARDALSEADTPAHRALAARWAAHEAAALAAAGESDAAEALFRAAEQTATESAEPVDTAWVALRHAQSAAQRGHHAVARRRLKDALNRGADTAGPHFWAVAECLLGDLAWADQDAATAEAHWRAAERKAQAIGAGGVEVEARLKAAGLGHESPAEAAQHGAECVPKLGQRGERLLQYFAAALAVLFAPPDPKRSHLEARLVQMLADAPLLDTTLAALLKRGLALHPGHAERLGPAIAAYRDRCAAAHRPRS